MSLRIRSVDISPAVNAKINSKHGVTSDDVLDACTAVLKSGWVEDEERGRRLFLEGKTSRGKHLLVVLYPTQQPDVWKLGTAYYG